jgi:hypothetical protein
MPWNGGWQVKVYAGNKYTLAKTNGAPSMTADTTGVVYLAYVGEHGNNVYVSQNDGKDLTVWRDGNAIKDEHGRLLQAKEAPVIAFWPISLLMFYIDHNSGNLFQTFPLVPAGTGWAAPAQVLAFPGNHWHEPIVIQAGFRLYLVALDHDGDPWYSYQSLDPTPGPNQPVINPFFAAKGLPRTKAQIKEQAQVKSWTLGVQPSNTNGATGKLLLFGIAEESFYLYSSQLTADGVDNGWLYEGPCPLPPSHAIAPQAFALSINIPADDVLMLFTLKGKDRLWTTDFTSSQVQIPPYTEIVAGNGRFRTNKRVAGTLNFPDLKSPIIYYIAYKDSQSDEMYFAFYTK